MDLAAHVTVRPGGGAGPVATETGGGWRKRRGAGHAAALCLLMGTMACGVAGANDLRDGNRALAAGRLDEALRRYEAAARDGVAAGQAGVGRVWLRRGRLEKAAEAFELALSMNPELAAAHYGAGEVLRHRGRCADAIPFFQRATSIDRKYPEAQLALGNCLVEVGQVERAIVELDRGLKWGREWTPRFLVARGAAWMARDSLRRAAVDFTRAREMAPHDAAVRKAIGEFYFARGTWALAIPELEAASALDSTDVEAQYSLAQALFYERSYDRALQVYERLIARAPDHAPGRLGIGDLLFRAGAADPRRYGEARVHLEEYVRLEPGDAKGRSLLGRTYHRLGLDDSARVALREAERLGERSPEIYSALGMVHAGAKEWEQAREYLEKGELSPREQPLLAQIYEVTGNPYRADSLYRQILARDSTSAVAAFALRQRAKILFRARSHAPAESLFARSLALDSASGEAWFYRGLCLKELSRPSEALDALQQAAAIDTGRADRLFWLGVLLDSQKRLVEADSAFLRSTEIDPEGELASRSYRQLGYYRLLNQDWAAAIRMLERAVELDPRDPQAWLWLGQGFQNSGERRRARESYRRVLELDPGNSAAKKGLGALGAASPAARESAGQLGNAGPREGRGPGEGAPRAAVGRTPRAPLDRGREAAS